MAVDQSSSMGAVIFFGLTGAALIGAMAPGDLEYLNPEDTHRRTGYTAAPPPTSWVDRFEWPVVTQNTDSAQDNRQPVALPIDAREDPFAPPVERVQAEAGTDLRHGFAAPMVQAPFAALLSPVSQIASPPAHKPELPAAQIGPAPPQLVAARMTLPRPSVAALLPQMDAPALAANDAHSAALAPVGRIPRQGILRAGRPDRPVVLRDALFIARVTGDQVNLRVAPDIAAETITQVPQNALGIVSQRRADWVRIEVSGQTGWMFSAFVVQQ